MTALAKAEAEAAAEKAAQVETEEIQDHQIVHQ
jgi:hypothetical protein